MFSTEMDAEITKTTQSLTTMAEMRNTTQMLMHPNANWEEYLAPAPLSIAIMGELVFISSINDFSINKNPPKDGFKFIKYPDSFRASLMQICNSGWHAFNLAHKNMDQIRIHTFMVPDYMKAVFKILLEGNDEIFETLLPNQLENIRSIADECVGLAEGVEKKYADVINIIQELLETCINIEHFHGEELEKVRMKLEENKSKMQTATKQNEESKEEMENKSKELEETQKQYKESMNSMPSGWGMIGMDFVEGLTSPLKLFGSLPAAIIKTVKKITSGSETKFNDEGDDVDMVSGMNIWSSGSQSASQRVTENARFLIEQSQEQLKQTRESYEKAVQNMQQKKIELTEILIEMQNCKIKEIDFDTAIKMLVKGMDAMGRVKEQWEKMVRFFQMVATIVKTSLETTLKNFVKTSEVTKRLSDNSMHFAIDMLHNQVLEASKIASLVHMISGTYCEVSNKYLMDRVSSLGKLMAMDKEKPEFMQERMKLQVSCQEAQDGIMHLVLKNRE